MGRIRNAIAALRGAPLPEPIPGGSFVLNMPGAFNTRPLNRKTQQADSYLGWVYAATSLIAGDIRSQDWWFEDAEEKEVDVQERAILERPNAFTTWCDLIEVTQLNIDLTGEAFWWLVGGEQFGAVRGIQHVPASWVIEAWVPGGVFQGWKMQIPGHAEQIVPGRDLVWFRNPHPSEPWRAISPVETFALSYNMDIYARAYGAALMQNWAQPPGILSSDQELTAEDAEALRVRWKSHRQSAESIAVLGKGARYEPLSISVKDLAFIDLARMTREQILGIYRVPPGKLGLAEEGGTAAEHAARDNTYAKNALAPRLNKLADTINTYVLPRLIQRAVKLPRFVFENPVRKDETFALTKAEQGLKSGVITINQYLIETDRDPLPGPEGDLYMLPTGITLVAKLEDGLSTQAVAAPPADPQNDPNDPKGNGDEEQGQKGQGQDQARGLLGRGWLPPGILPGLTTKDMDEAEGRYLARQGRNENRLAGEIRRILRREGKAVAESIRIGAVTAAHEPGASVIELAHGEAMALEWDLKPHNRDVIDDILSRYARQWEREVERASMLGLEDGWALLAQDAGRALVDFALFLPQARSIAAANAGKKIVDIRSTTSKAVRKTIANAISEGTSIPEIANQIEALYEDWRGYRAETIARTETAYAVNRGRDEHAIAAEQRLGVRIYNTWLAVSDDRTREHHVQANGQRVRQGEYFNVGDANLLYPGDSDNGAPPEETINCFLPGTLVRGEFVAGLEARYSGQAVELRTAGGRRLSVTPNHPVLTADGMVAASALRQGDKLVCYSDRIERVQDASAAHEENAPLPIEQVTGSFAIRIPVERGSSRLDLHGDARFIDGDVHVVLPDGQLAVECDPPEQRVADGRFGGALQSTTRDSSPDHFSVASSPASGLGPGGGALPLRGRPVHGLPLQSLRVGASAQLDSGFLEAPHERDSYVSRFAGELIQRNAGAITLDELVEVRNFQWSGQVYDLQSVTGFLVANGIIASNCRCTTVSEVFDS